MAEQRVSLFNENYGNILLKRKSLSLEERSAAAEGFRVRYK
jgi:hypothetical protein